MDSKLFALLLSGALFAGLGPHIYAADSPNTEIRAAIDIGSGATKLKVAKVDLDTQKIASVIYMEELPVEYQTHLENSPDQTFDPEVEAVGLKAMQHFKEVANQHGAQKIVGVATSAFRNARNAPEFVRKIEESTNIKVYVIDQELEGILGFNAASAVTSYSPDDIVVWDIGGGSLQFTAEWPDGQYHVYKGSVGSIPFKNDVMQRIQWKDPRMIASPNPMNEQEISQAITHAELVARNVDCYVRARLQQMDTHVIAVGSLFRFGIQELVGSPTVTQKTLKEKIYALKDKDDAALGNNPFSSIAVTNGIYVYGMMKALGINPVSIVDINNADGALLYAPFWQQQ